jgi:YidC/Oxa1 family membrane protein insertase
MLDPLFELISNLLNFFYTLVPNYAVAIGLLTLVVMVVTTPLTLKGTRSMIEMQRLQPEMRRIQLQYKDDRQKQQEEMMRFYREHQINPLGGCFPLLVQAPVFSILFYVVRGLTNSYKFTGLQRTLGDVGFDPVIREGFRPKYLDRSTELYQALLGQDHMNAFGIDLARSASAALTDSFLEALPYLGMVAVIALLSWYQQRQIMGRNPNTEMTQQQRTMMIIGPAIYIFFAFVSPMAIGIYFLVSTIWRVGQQAYITRSLYHGDDAPGVQAQKAMAELRKERAKDGPAAGAGRRTAAAGGGSGKGGAGKAGARVKGDGKASQNGSSNSGGQAGGGRASGGKAGAGSRSGTTSDGGGAGAGGGSASRPHPRSRKKKKRK